MKQTQTIITNAFYHYANEYRKLLTKEEDIEKINFTDVFFHELELMGQKKEPININVWGDSASGKTTLAFEIAQHVMKSIYKRDFTITDVDRDQHEYSNSMSNPEIHDTIRVVDEWDEMEDTGEDASVLQKLYSHFCEVMGQRFVHKISCSVKNIADPTARIIIHMIPSSINKDEMKSYAKIYYKVSNGTIEYPQLLGYLEICVAEILAKPWYLEYRRRKFAKMELLTVKGIMKPRLLEYAEPILNVTNSLKKIVVITNALTPGAIRSHIKIEARKFKQAKSIIGEKLATDEVQGILELYKAEAKIEHDIQKLTRIIQNSQKQQLEKKYAENDPELISELDTRRDLAQKINELREGQQAIQSSINTQIQELEEYKKIYEEHKQILL